MSEDESLPPSTPPGSPPTPFGVDTPRSLAVRNKGKQSEGEQQTNRKRRLENGAEAGARRRTREHSRQLEEPDDSDAYDPEQPMEERRRIQRDLRELQKGPKENPDEFMQADNKPYFDYLDKADSIVEQVKQTSEAAIESRGLLIAADLSTRRVQRLTMGNMAHGVDVDEFVSKCLTYMLQGRGYQDDNAAGLTSTQRQRRRPTRGAIGSDDEDDVGDEGDSYNWEHLGRFAAIPSVKRPALPGFLLGPLSVEKKVRKVVRRTQPLKINSLHQIRPQEINAEDLGRSEKNDLTRICTKIHKQLRDVQTEAQNEAEAAHDSGLDVDEVMERYGLRSTGGIDLLKFVVNPHSFGQTVENMFYVSFLIKDGKIKLEYDDDGLPTLAEVEEVEDGERGAARPAASDSNAKRQQAVMSIDMKTWREVIDVFDIKEPMIEHRREQVNAGPGARGWYS